MSVKLPPRPAMPVPPAALAAEMREQNQAMREVDRALRAGLATGDHVALDEAADRLRDALLNPRPTTEQQRTERDRWAVDVAKYNEAAAAYNAALKARRQERVNASQVRAVRAAACTRCFATHAGEC